MGNCACCRSCRHCSPPSSVEMGWCQLRKLPIHPDLASEVWCHHWIARPPRLPVMAHPAGGLESQVQNRQLILSDLLEP